MICDCGCGIELMGKQQRWASRQCCDRWYARQKRKSARPYTPNRITDAKLAEVKAQFPILTCDLETADFPVRVDRLIRRLERLGVRWH